MFYSQTFLARKGPLGTVWCAAHLQHRLRKSHYTSTNILSTVDRIMFPDVPIALRLSGHLLLGVVRIYSKKVHYLLHDCEFVLNGFLKALTSIQVTLPENASTAKFESVTLPQTFDLDALDVDNDLFLDGSPDNHMRSRDEITLTDQIPTGRDPYVIISFDEDVPMDGLPPEQDPNSRLRSTEEEIATPPPVDHDVGFDTSLHRETEAINEAGIFGGPGPSNQTEVLTRNVDFQDPGPSNQTEVLTRNEDSQDPGPSNQTEFLGSSTPRDDDSPQAMEVMRSAFNDVSLENIPLGSPDHLKDPHGPNGISDHVLNEEILSPIMEDDLLQHSEAHISAASKDASEIFRADVSFGHNSPELNIIPSPPIRQPQQRPRKRKFFFDKSTVLANKFMKNALEDCNDIKRKRKEIPSSALGIWKLNNNLRREKFYQEPLVTGLCPDICNLFKEAISSKHHFTLEEEAIPETRTVTSPTSAAEPSNAVSPAPFAEAIPELNATSSGTAAEAVLAPGSATFPSSATIVTKEPLLAPSSAFEPEIDMEVEHLRDDEGPYGNEILPEFLPPTGLVPSPSRRNDFTPDSANNVGSERVPWAGDPSGTCTLPTPVVPASFGAYDSGMETPRTLLDEQHGGEDVGFSDIPEQDLYFLEADNSPAASRGSQGAESLSVRTRAVAQYLKEHSPIISSSEDLSLNKILQGKTRKICARMFFETLVLKSYGLIEVQQEQPYGDIKLKLATTLSKAQKRVYIS